MPYYISTHVAVMIVSPPISSGQCVLTNVSLLEYRVSNNQVLGCSDVSYSDNMTITVCTKLFIFVLFVKCLKYLTL
jgi:hypothetical protein